MWVSEHHWLSFFHLDINIKFQMIYMNTHLVVKNKTTIS